MQRGRSNPPLFWTVVVVVVVADVITKSLAVSTLFPQRMPHELLGSAVRLTLVYNPGAAFGLHLGAYSRWIFMALTVGALVHSRPALPRHAGRRPDPHGWQSRSCAAVRSAI